MPVSAILTSSKSCHYLVSVSSPVKMQVMFVCLCNKDNVAEKIDGLGQC